MLPVEAGWSGALAVRGRSWRLRLQNPLRAPARGAVTLAR
jgi:hypothetical protein